MVFKAGFVLNVASTPSPNGACVGVLASQHHNRVPLSYIKLPFELVFASATCKTAPCRGGLGEAHVNPPRHKSLVYANAGVSSYL